MTVNFLSLCGAFFLGKKPKEDQGIYDAILKDYLSVILNETPYLEFFIEKTRSRTGKVGKPDNPFFNLITDQFFEGKFKEMNFVPISISWDNVIGAGSLAMELEGENV